LHVIIANIDNAIRVVENARKSIRAVTFGVDALVPIVVRVGALLPHN
jgi:hypothetical protein